jgi:hypothetical protein
VLVGTGKAIVVVLQALALLLVLSVWCLRWASKLKAVTSQTRYQAVSGPVLVPYSVVDVTKVGVVMAEPPKEIEADSVLQQAAWPVERVEQ